MALPSDGDATLILANAAHVKNVPGRNTDVADAVWLSDLLAHGLIRASFVPEPATQAMRSLLRTRKQLIREQASHVQRLGGFKFRDEHHVNARRSKCIANRNFLNIAVAGCLATHNSAAITPDID